MKKALIGVVGVVAIIVIAAFAALWLVDWNSYAAKAVREATGRELRIGGDLSLSLLPNIEFSASDVSLSNAPGMAPAEMVSVGAVRVKLKLWPLLRRRVMLDTLVIRQPSVFLEISKAGQPNWAFKDKDASASAEEPVEAPAERRGPLPINDIRLGDVRVEQGLVSYTDATTGQKLLAKDINLTVTLPDLGSLLSLTGKLTLNDKPITVDVSVDSLRGALSGKRFAAKAAVSSKLVSARYDGSAQQEPVPGLDGKFNLSLSTPLSRIPGRSRYARRSRRTVRRLRSRRPRSRARLSRRRPLAASMGLARSRR
jgi:AsmA protein